MPLDNDILTNVYAMIDYDMCARESVLKGQDYLYKTMILYGYGV